MENRKPNYKPGTAGAIIQDAIMGMLDLPGMHADREILIGHIFGTLARAGHLTKTIDIRIVKVLRELVKAGLLRKKGDGYVRC